MSFSGSYHPQDVTLLLRPISVAPMPDLAEKERLIQTGQRHYSEMLSPERLPSQRYLELFHRALAANGARMARDVVCLARSIRRDYPGGVVLASLARAGTPVGVLLRRALEKTYLHEVPHYSISIIRDRGIDSVALRHILRETQNSKRAVVFVDGWTGKGTICRELAKSIRAFNSECGTQLAPDLYVLSDLAGTAKVAASTDDYLIPSSILNATVSGLVSRSILNAETGPADFHGCVFYREFAAHDLSRTFVDHISSLFEQVENSGASVRASNIDAREIARTSRTFVRMTMARYRVSDENFIKPGIGEATRVLLRRVPRLLILRNLAAVDVAHLLMLAEEKGVEVVVDSSLPYQAVALIQGLHHA